MRVVSRVDDRGRAPVSAARTARRTGDERVRVTPDSLADVQDAGLALAASWTDSRRRSSFCATRHQAASPRDRRSSKTCCSLRHERAAVRSDLKTLLSASDTDFVYFLEVRGRGVFLRAAPIDVSRVVREHLLERCATTVLTSATLAVDGRFDYVRRRLGIRRATELRLASEFDYASQALLYLPRRMPPPQDAGFADAVARECLEILRRTEGRAFVLFTSYAMLRAVEPILRERARLSDPGPGPRAALGADRQFRATPPIAVLLATSSFWQGVDVVGDALSCVIIDKLPFASPGDPVTAARMEAVSAAAATRLASIRCRWRF